MISVGSEVQVLPGPYFRACGMKVSPGGRLSGLRREGAAAQGLNALTLCVAPGCRRCTERSACCGPRCDAAVSRAAPANARAYRERPDRAASGQGGGVAQWESTCFASRGSSVRIRPSPGICPRWLRRRFPDLVWSRLERLLAVVGQMASGKTRLCGAREGLRGVSPAIFVMVNQDLVLSTGQPCLARAGFGCSGE